MPMDVPTPDNDVTILLRRASRGEPAAWDRAFRILYDELRRIAARELGRERPGHTLQATALVNEAYLKLVKNPPEGPAGRAHFVSVAARAMRQVLVDHARARSAAKRGGGVVPQTLTPDFSDVSVDPLEVLALDEALDELDGIDSQLRQVVELRYFGGLNDSEIAALLGVTRRTAQRYWSRARAWLHRALTNEGGHGER